MSVREKAVQFGKSTTMVGILTEPPAGTVTRKPAVLLLNSGIIHRVGSCRFHVTVARTLAPLGYTVLRFDYSGIGDSEPRRDNLSFEESAVVETREAMDYLQGKGINEFVLMGLCSGADMAHETAVADPRVRAMVLLDAWAWKNFGWYWTYYGPKLLRPSAWFNFVAVRVKEALGKGRSGPSTVRGEGVEIELPRYVRVFPPRQRIAKDLRLFMERDLKLFYIWTGGLWEYNHRSQHEETFRSVGFNGRVRVEHLKEANHILTGLQHQSWVAQQTAAWLEQLYPAGRQPPQSGDRPAPAPLAAERA